MSDTAQPASAPASAEPSSTPAPAAAAPPETSPPPAAPAASATPVPTPPGAEPAPSAVPAAPLFKLPESMKVAPEALTKFEHSLRAKLSNDGKLAITPQEVADIFAAQANDAYTAWQTQIARQDSENATLCKARFNASQLQAAESAVGFLSSFEPGFRDFSKSFMNHPTFVNAMRIVGERLSEDTFEVGGAMPAAPAKKSPAERMGYAKPRQN